ICRSKYYAEITYKKFADELEANMANGVYALKGAENNRITWEGIAVWPHLSHTFKTVKGMNICMTGSAYPKLWDFVYTPGDMDSMAEAYTKVYLNTCLNNRAKVLEEIVVNGQSDGVLYHLNRSCKIMAFLNSDVAEIIQKDTGLPYGNFDGDQTDPRNFSPAQFDTRVQALNEIMSEKK
ncbi:MAG: 2-hydroxyacyl-CoA dehydratase family protein, partial [Fusobacteriaceae bacterium]|nr:2-hydroxyacyl-CoA dehydratase family protein [Fusobacteriaceae bacterium]